MNHSESGSTFYASPREAVAAPPERLAYVAALDPAATRPDAIAVVDADPESVSYGRVVGWTDLPYVGDELHHFGWNACSSALCHSGHHPGAERRFLIVPGLRSSRIYVLDTKPDPTRPEVVKVLGADDLAQVAGYSRPHTIHCGPDGIYVSALGGGDTREGPGGVALLDHTSYEIRGAWERDRGPQYLAYDFWWHLTNNVMITSEWGTPSMIEDGLQADQLLGRQYGHAIHFWDLRRGTHLQRIDLGDQHQMVLELRPAHDPEQTYGFAGVVISVEDLSASVWLWHRDDGRWAATKVISIPATPADPQQLPDALKPFGAVPPFVTDIDLSVDDRFLYVSCWGTGELKQYDVSDPFHPRETGAVRIGGVAARAAHPAHPTYRSPAGRRWSRSAGTAAGST
jgi:selenium-binding protein 1